MTISAYLSYIIIHNYVYYVYVIHNNVYYTQNTNLGI